MTEPSTPPLVLPAALARDPVMREFAARLALMLEPFPRALEDFPRLLDAWRTDPAWLDWLSRITGAPDTEQWDEAARRAAVESAAALAARRGTHEALVQEAALLGWELSLYDPGRVSTADQPFGARRSLVAALAWSPADTVRLVSARPQLDAIVRRHCPAHLPYTIVVGEGFTPSAALSLPPGADGEGQPRTVFFYGPHPEGDQTIGYDLSVPAPVPGPRRLDTRWTGLDQLGNDGKNFAKGERGYIDGAACYPDIGFYLISGDKAAVWDKSAQAFNKIVSLNTIFPGLPQTQPTQAVNNAPAIRTPLVDDVLSITSGSNKGLYVFSGEHAIHYSSPGATTPDTKKIKERYTSDLPPEFHRDIDAIVEDPLHTGIHYLVKGPQCAEADGFTYKATHLIRDLWPGIPVRTASEQTGGGALTIEATLIPLHSGFRLSYFARALTESAYVYLYEGPKKTPAELAALHVVSQKPAPGSAGAILFEDNILKSPGSYTLYYVDPAFNKRLSDPAEFTAILKKENYGTFSLKNTGGKTANRKDPQFTCQTPYPQGATLALYHAGDNASDLDQAQKEIPAPLYTKPIANQTTAQDVTVDTTLPPGPYKAYLLARDGHAFLAEPLKDITLTLDENAIGTLHLGGTSADDTKGTIPLDQKPVISYTPSGAETWTAGTLHVFRQTAQDAAANTLPAATAVHTYTVDLKSPFTLTDSLPVGGYTAYLCAGNAWLTKPKRFTVTAPVTSGQLTVKTPSSDGTANVLTYTTPYADSGNQIVVIPEHDTKPPEINTDSSQWHDSVYRITAAKQNDEITITAANLLPQASSLEAMPGNYYVHFVTDTGAPLAAPVKISVTLKPSQYETLRITEPLPVTGITTASTVTVEFTNKYFSPNHAHHIAVTGPAGWITNTQITQGQTRQTIPAAAKPGRCTINYWAYPIPLVAPLTYLVHAAPAGAITLPQTPPNVGTKITIGYQTEFPWTEGSPDPNRIEIYNKNDQPGTAQPVQSLKAPGKTGSVEAVGLPGGQYRVYFLGKDNSTLAPAQEIEVKARTVVLHVADATHDSWTVKPVQLTGCTAGGQPAVPATPAGGNPAYTDVTFIQSATALEQMSGTLECTHPEHSQKLTITWTMKTADESITYRTTDSDGLTAKFSSDKTTWANPASGTGPNAQIWVNLQNTKHRTLSATITNTLPFALELDGTPVPVNATASTAPQRVSNGETKKFTYTTDSSPADSSGTVTYKFTPPDNKPEQTLTLSWVSHPGKKPEYTLTLPDKATVEGNKSVWTISSQTTGGKNTWTIT
ncbi:phage tail protein [Streptomyces sp. NPDC007861]|uniref:phage tail protein n=1 Tax=Streptomyces sp. NPDC007861 TaxID=3154893 RepID=UPI0034113F4A